MAQGDAPTKFKALCQCSKRYAVGDKRLSEPNNEVKAAAVSLQVQSR